MRNKAGNIFIMTGIALVLAALSLFGWNRMESRRADNAVQRILPAVVDAIDDPVQELPTELPQMAETEQKGTEMTVVEIDGYGYVGYLSIPALELELPVMSEWDYARLKIAPCRYSGSTRTNDLVICAHNYERHFGSIRSLLPGDEVVFTDMDGKAWHYAVETVETLEPTAVEEMTDGGYDLTLFTCTYGGATRVTVRCDRVCDVNPGKN